MNYNTWDVLQPRPGLMYHKNLLLKLLPSKPLLPIYYFDVVFLIH